MEVLENSGFLSVRVILLENEMKLPFFLFSNPYSILAYFQLVCFVRFLDATEVNVDLSSVHFCHFVHVALSLWCLFAGAVPCCGGRSRQDAA